LPDLFSTETERPARAQERPATHAAISVVSPGREDEDEKNQDRVTFREVGDGAGAGCQFGIVCDGTSTSPFSADAAEHVSRQVDTLFEEGGLRRVVEELKEMRLALLAKPVVIEEVQSEPLRSMFEEIVRHKYQISYQTTFVAVRLKRDEDDSPGTVSVKAIGCGDSALFIFREGGELLYNNVNLDDELDRFKHGSPITAVLPDSYDEERDYALPASGEYPEDVHLLLCSDGLYDGFTNFKEIRDWLHRHRAELSHPETRQECMAELHGNLGRKKGDDDISFIWLFPLPPPQEEAKGAEAEELENRFPKDPDGRERGLFIRLLAAVLRFFNLRTQ